VGSKRAELAEIGFVAIQAALVRKWRLISDVRLADGLPAMWDRMAV
jgi:hypothetical protein